MDAEAGEIKWNVIAILEQQSPTGKTYREEAWYWLTLQKENRQWKISEVSRE